MRTIQPADPRAQRRLVVVTLMSVALLGVASIALDRWLAEVASRDPEQARRLLALALRWSASIVAVLVALFGRYAYWLGRKIVCHERFPPPGTLVIRDTPVLEGARARLRGRLIQAVAAALAIVALALPLVAFRLAARLE